MTQQPNNPSAFSSSVGNSRMARAVQRKSGLKLAEYLRHQGKLKENELMEYVSNQLQIDKYDPKTYPFEQSLSRIIDPETARKHGICAIKEKGGLVYVATSDPLNVSLLDTLEKSLKLDLEPVYCPKGDLDELIYQYYGKAAALGDMQSAIDELEVEEGEEEQIVDISMAALEDAPVVKLVNQILYQAVNEGASDIHISPQRDRVQLRFRVDGILREYPAPPKSIFMQVISRMKLISNMDISVTRVPQDGRFSFNVQTREVNVRASALPTIYGENMVLRLLIRKRGTLQLEELGMTEEDMQRIEEATSKSYGMILATGPTGSGKTTLLYSLLHRIDKPEINIITLEDPVEHRVDTIRQVQLNRKAGMTFASGLRSILRQDPDVLMVGEIRDHETAQIAVESAMTGHRLLSTVHTNDAAGAVTRFIDMGIEPFLVASTLLCVVGQRLMRRNCQECLEEYQPPQKYVDALKLKREVKFFRGRGCPKCRDSGYSGRTGVYEVLNIDEQIQELIIKRVSSRDIARAAQASKKFRPMRQDALNKVLKGITTLEEAAPLIFM
ncbi:GspE/PulE family protein [Oceanidesulfovibrio marinus]|uniref:General secretion pathway protein GspE n=1 Tax=Oceanidesulfovibrio marinus TaxID=370038 RepID=A0A6P1ZLK9_9BACT|nr:GspE/PulE family protein [Oceanidesulfovibrio marinus]QJT08918.1 type II/IV secretion system protein [Oceanidesulfovibrio marinus]TVM36662.1 general secretion pathway protein GspE [Oceanidesulfovibrio marinus]